MLRQRKGYADMNGELDKVLEAWGLQDSKTKQVYDTAWQVGEEYVLKVYQDRKMLERNLKILEILNETGIPVGKAISDKTGNQYVSEGSHFYFLSEKLSGSNILQIGSDTELAGTMGSVIADLHIALQKCESEGDFWDNSLLDEMNAWVREQFEECAWKYISQEEFQKVVSELDALYGELPVQLIHRDVHFGNFLFDEGKFSGYIDFDLSQRNIRIFDLCYFLLGLLSEEEKLEISEEQWFDFVTKVFIGYEQKQPLSEAERQAVPCVMECIELLFTAYFEGQKDLCCAENAYRIYKFVRKHEKKIWELLGSII